MNYSYTPRNAYLAVIWYCLLIISISSLCIIQIMFRLYLCICVLLLTWGMLKFSIWLIHPFLFLIFPFFSLDILKPYCLAHTHRIFCLFDELLFLLLLNAHISPYISDIFLKIYLVFNMNMVCVYTCMCMCTCILSGSSKYVPFLQICNILSSIGTWRTSFLAFLLYRRWIILPFCLLRLYFGYVSFLKDIFA